MINGITPTCRYGHGDLKRIEHGAKSDSWSYVNAMDASIHFSGILYLCTTCGYSELFDDDLPTTKNTEGVL